MDPSVIEEFENTFAFEDIDTDVLITDPDVPLWKTFEVVDFVNCFVEELPSRFDSTLFTEDDILEDWVKLETDVPSVLLAEKDTVGIAEDDVSGRIEEDGTVNKLSEDNETDEEIVDDCWEDTADVCSTDDKITEELDKTDSDRDDDEDKDEDIAASEELLTTEELADVGAGVII